MLTGGITKQMRKFPNYKFILMGVFDAIGVVVSTIPAAYATGPTVVVMAQGIVVINLIASFIFLKFRYTFFHYVGMLLVVCGITIEVFPALAGTQSGADDKYNWVWLLLLFLANIPMAASNVYKEKYLKEAKLDVWYMNAWVALYQLIFGFISFPIVYIPTPDRDGRRTFINFYDTWTYLGNSWKCFAGINSQDNDMCDYFYAIFIIFMAFNMTYNILMLIVFQKGSSTLAVVASAARLALSNLGFLIKFLAGEAYQPELTYFDIIALFVLMAGIVVYSATREYIADDSDFFVRTWNTVFSCCNKKKKVIADPNMRGRYDEIARYDYNTKGGGEVIYLDQ
ncbi:hypothetical protein AKO1_011993 [Acrasis kona]|uniref:Uncharacterized protein n=1 Tax=Acrasis kona TaxID=1008807 RepID=A0AAW2Z9A7_9EUKA